MRILLFALISLLIATTSCDEVSKGTYFVEKIQIDSLSFPESVEGLDNDTVNWIGHVDSTGFSVNKLRFLNTYNSDSDWSGFAYSRSKDKSKKDSSNLTTSYTGTGAFESLVYLVANLSGTCRIESQETDGYIFEEMYVVPTWYSYHKILEGDEYYHKIGGANSLEQDSIFLSFDLYKNNAKIGQKELLIGFSNGQGGSGKVIEILDEWTPISFREFGQIDAIELRLRHNLLKQSGIIPELYCIDQIVVAREY